MKQYDYLIVGSGLFGEPLLILLKNNVRSAW